VLLDCVVLGGGKLEGKFGIGLVASVVGFGKLRGIVIIGRRCGISWLGRRFGGVQRGDSAVIQVVLQQIPWERDISSSLY
jgi:hypothetical protein